MNVHTCIALKCINKYRQHTKRITLFKRSPMKIVFIFSAFFILSIHASGAKIPADTTQPRKPWKISKQEFLDKYGKDDTSYTLIQYFLKRRKAGQVITISGALITTG